MATPISELLTLQVVTALEDISTANGYEIDPADVVREVTPRSKSLAPEHHLIVVRQGSRTNVSGGAGKLSNGAGTSLVDWRQEYEIDFYSMPTDDTTGVALDSFINDGVADIEKAVIKLFNTDQMGGYAHMVELQGHQPASSDEFDGAIVSVALTYRVEEPDPYTQG